MSSGYVYLLLNATMPGYLKIGMTRRLPEERARELSQATGVAVPYVVAFAVEVKDCDSAERLIHDRLAAFRVNRGREFFHLPVQDAIRELSDIADDVGRLTSNNQNARNGSLASTTTFSQEPSLFNEQPSSSRSEAAKEQDRLAELPDELQRLYLELRDRAVAFGPDVVVYATRQNLVFKAGKMFAEIMGKKRALRVLIRPEGFNIPANSSALVHGITVTRVPDNYLWAVNHKFEVDCNSPLDGVEKLLRQSYQAVVQRD